MAKTKKDEVKPGPIWYIGFRPVSQGLPLPWRWFINPNYAHVLAFRYDADIQKWVFVEWGGRVIYVEVWPGEKMDRLFAWLKQDGALISYETTIHLETQWKFRMPFYCVSWVKHLLGLRNCAAVTPYQLFCALKKRGGTVIFEYGEQI